MMTRSIFPIAAIAVLAWGIKQSAAQQPDPAALARIIPVLQQQRNDALDKAALAEARALQSADALRQTQDEVAKLKAELAAAKPAKE